MRLVVLAPVVFVGAFLAACADEDITTPPTATSEPATTATASPEAQSPPEVGEGPVVTYLGEPIGNAGAEALPIEVDSAGALFLDWNGDGSLLAYVSGGDIWVYDGEESRNLTNTPDVLEGMPVWSPDGSMLAFASRPFEEGEQPEALLAPQGGPAVMNVDGSDVRALEDTALLWPPAWSPEGDRLAYARASGDVLIRDLEGTLVRQQTAPTAGVGDDLGAVSWSPVRDEVAFHYAFTPGGQIEEGAVGTQGVAVLRVGDERGIVIVHDFEGPYVPLPPPEWSADGERLLIAVPPSSTPNSDPGLWIAERAEPRTFSGEPLRSEPARRVEGIVPYQARWSPEGERIAVIENGERRILVLDADTLEVIGEPGPAEGVEGIAWRP